MKLRDRVCAWGLGIGVFLIVAASGRAQTEEQQIRDRFAAAVAAYSAGTNISAFMSHFSADYLYGGETYADLRASVLDDWAEPGFSGASGYTLGAVTVNGDLASMIVIWDGEVEIETEYFRKELGNWLGYGDQREYEVEVETTHMADVQPGGDDIWINLMAYDPKNTITSVQVSGPGITGSVVLNERIPQVGSDEEHAWVSWSTGAGASHVSPSFTNANRPGVGSEYTFVIQDTTRATVTLTSPITGYVDVFATNTSPAPNEVVTTTMPMLSWTGAGAGYSYSAAVRLESGGADLWNEYDLMSTSIQYSGPPLVRNTPYTFQVGVRDGYENSSLVWIPFSYNSLAVSTTATPLAYIEDDGAVTVDPGLVLTNANATQVTGATVAISNGYLDTEDSLGFTAGSGINGSFNVGSGVLTLTGTASTAAYQSVLRSVTYTNASQYPTEHARTVTFQFFDSSRAGSNIASRRIDVTGVNDVPTLTNIDLLTGAQADSDFGISHATLLAASDAADQETLPVAFRVEAVNSGTLSEGVTPVTPGSSLLNPGSVWTWHPPAGVTGTVNAFQVRAWDGAQASAAAVQVRVQVDSPADIAVWQGATPIANSIATPFDFGTANLFGGTPEFSFTIANNGAGNLQLGTVTLLNNRGFSITQQPAGTVPAGGNTTLTVRMSTATTGAMTAQVRFATNDSDDNPFVFAVAGTVVGTGDVDGDGMDDAWETFWFGPGGADPHADADGDGWSNLQEHERGTDPTSYVLRLEAGWNLVSLARVPTANSVADIFGSYSIGPVYVWAGDHYAATTELEPLRGHWVYVLAPVDITITLP